MTRGGFMIVSILVIIGVGLVVAYAEWKPNKDLGRGIAAFFLVACAFTLAPIAYTLLVGYSGYKLTQLGSPGGIERTNSVRRVLVALLVVLLLGMCLLQGLLTLVP